MMPISTSPEMLSQLPLVLAGVAGQPGQENPREKEATAVILSSPTRLRSAVEAVALGLITQTTAAPAAAAAVAVALTPDLAATGLPVRAMTAATE
jgi:hypothetical protein